MNAEIEILINRLEQGYHKESVLSLTELIERSIFKNRSGPPYINLSPKLAEIRLTHDERIEIANRLFAILNREYEGDIVSILWILSKISHLSMLDESLNLANVKVSTMTKEEINQLLTLLDNIVSSYDIDEIQRKKLAIVLERIKTQIQGEHPVNTNIFGLIKYIYFAINRP